QAGESSDKIAYTADSTANVVAVSLVGGGGVVPLAESTGGTEALLGAPSGVTGVNTDATEIAVTGAITTQTYSFLHALAVTHSIAAARAAANIQSATATAGGSTRAYAGDGADITAGSLGLTASATLAADATTSGVGVALATVSGVQATATVTSITEAYLGKNADAGAGSVSLHLSGPTTINATSNNTANA